MNHISSIPKEWLRPHPVLPLPSQPQVLAFLAQGDDGIRALEDLLSKRADLMKREELDPLRYGFEPETYAMARSLLDEYDELLLMGANREGKTNFAAKYSVETLMQPGKVCAFFHSSERSSIDQQQPVIHGFLPPEWRSLNLRTKDIYVSYSRATGFSNFKIILPNRSIGYFYNYKQDVGVMEGYEYDLVWFDELVPMAFLEALTFRLSQQRRMKILTTFTPTHGYTTTVASYVGGARVIKTRKAELLPENARHAPNCPPGHMPQVMTGRRSRSAVLFFHWGQNPYGAAEEVRKKLVGASTTTIKMRAYGWADKMVTSALPKFGAPHILNLAAWEKISKQPGTHYMATDPGGSKNWVIKWYFVTPQGWKIVYREWPDYQRYGEWALPPNDTSAGQPQFTWRAGPAHRLEAGRGISAYKRLILEAEGWRWSDAAGLSKVDGAQEIAARYIDPRMGGAAVPGVDEGTSIIELAAEEHRDARGRLIAPAMDLEAAPASGVEETVQMLADAMDYDENEPISVLNCPSWYVVENCLQSIKAYQEFTGAGGEKDALKDFIDPDRYFIKTSPRHLTPQANRVRKGGHW